MNIETISLTHANNDQRIEIVRGLVAGFYYSPAQKCTYVVAAGGAVFPAKESVEEVARLLKGAHSPVLKNTAKEAVKHGRKK